MLERKIIQEIGYPPFMSLELAERWADEIPTFSENNPENPEWPSTPTFELDLSQEGYGTVYVKDESQNPTGTIKDRLAWELNTLFRRHGRALWLKKKAGKINCNIHELPVPRLSIVTAGNVGKSISEAFKKYKLPPMKLLIDSSLPESTLESLKKLHADIYQTDLSARQLTAQKIKWLTNNQAGVDLTSVRGFAPHEVFYDWHVHEAFNENPDEIYVPFGSGRLMENYLSWQEKSMRNDENGTPDPRLNIPLKRAISIDVFGSEPVNHDSDADKLTKTYNPFRIFENCDISALKSFSFTGTQTGVYRVPEEKIKQAYELLSKHCHTEASGSTGLALYLHRFGEGKIDPKKKVLIVNTGKGI